jgi:hypothetical protein
MPWWVLVVTLLAGASVGLVIAWWTLGGGTPRALLVTANRAVVVQVRPAETPPVGTVNAANPPKVRVEESYRDAWWTIGPDGSLRWLDSKAGGVAVPRPVSSMVVAGGYLWALDETGARVYKVDAIARRCVTVFPVDRSPEVPCPLQV